MENYKPPFTITETMLQLAVEIGKKTERMTGLLFLDAKPYLRRNNRIRSIHSSLAIEANSLSLEEVRGVIEGKTVLGPEKEIREVQNAYAAYALLGSFDPFSLRELQRLHGILTEGTVAEPGVFRSRNEGVFSGDVCIFMAPPPRLVPGLMQNLFDWMREVRDSLHPLILSSVFHYEFVFIHPFSDGNGRMARLWQTALLSEWDPVFRYLPLESRIREFQEEYYAAIAACHRAGNSDAFIEFMLDKISCALDQTLNQMGEPEGALSLQVRKLMEVMEPGQPYTAARLMERLGLRARSSFLKHYLRPALERGLIEMGFPDKPTSRNQTYIRR